MSTDPTEASPTMDCAELAQVLEAYLDGELAHPEACEVEGHLARCERCRELAAEAARARAAVRSRLQEALAPRSRAPDELRERVREALRRERRARRRLRVRLAALAAIALVAVLVAVRLATRAPDPLAVESVRKHRRELPLEPASAGLDRRGVTGFFAGKLDFDPAPPRFPGEPIRVVGARLSNLQGHPAAYVRYELPRGRLGLFVVDGPGPAPASSLAQVLAPARGSAAVRLVTLGGFRVALWRRDELVYALVGDLDAAELDRLARLAQAETRAEP